MIETNRVGTGPAPNVYKLACITCSRYKDPIVILFQAPRDYCTAAYTHSNLQF